MEGGVDSMGYYGYLARTVPARRLARVMTSRVWRQVRNTLGAGEVNAPTPEEILSAYRVKTPQQLPGRLAARVPGPFGFGSIAGVRDCVRILIERLPAEAELLREQARRALAREVRIFGAVGTLIPADREIPLASPSARAIDWEANPVAPRGQGDPKLPWVVGRLEELVHLAMGAALTREDDPSFSRACADEAIDRLLDLWSAPRGIQWTCAMEVALRGANAAIALRILAGHPVWRERGEALLEIFRCLSFHVAWVEAHLEDTVAVPNNHLVSNLVGILTVGALHPSLPGVDAAASRARPRLTEELMAQTLADGMSFEGSVAYHRLAVELFFLGELASSALGFPWEPGPKQRLVEMFAATRELTDGRGQAPQIGDNDSGRALPFRQRHPQEQLYLLPMGAVRYGRADLHLGEAGAEFIWLLGASAWKHLEDIPRATIPRDSGLIHGGIFVMRSNRWSCAIACGPNGTGGTGTHGHNDKLSVEICLDGRLLVGDPGTGSYTGDPALRNRLRSTFVHNTVAVDGEEQQPLPPGRLFALPEVASARCVEFETGKNRSRFVGEHRGYLRLSPSVVHRREVVLDRDTDKLILTDILLGEGDVRAEVRFLFPEGARLRPATEEEAGHLASLGWRSRQANVVATIVEIGPEGAPAATLIAAGATGAPKIETGIYSEGYGETRDAPHVCFPLEGRLPMVFSVMLLPKAEVVGRQGEGEWP